MTTPLSLVAVFGSRIRDPGSGMGKKSRSGMGKNQDPGWRNKHPGSATLLFLHWSFNVFFLIESEVVRVEAGKMAETAVGEEKEDDDDDDSMEEEEEDEDDVVEEDRENILPQV